MFDLIPTVTKPRFVHHADRILRSVVHCHCRTWPNPAMQRTDEALDAALQTDFTVVQQDDCGTALAVSLPIPQRFVSMVPPWNVVSPIEILFHHRDRNESADFLARTVLPRQIVLMREKFAHALVYMVIRQASNQAAILEEHGWTEFEPEPELVLCREQTGATCGLKGRWFKAPVKSSR